LVTASVKVVVAVPLDGPVAVKSNSWPTQSSLQTTQVVVKLPPASAVTVHGSWPSPVEGEPSAWVTWSVTSSPGCQPEPVMMAVAPGG
jgi:hypothetical protein